MKRVLAPLLFLPFVLLPLHAQGNYEVISARCAEGSGERLVDEAQRLLKELYQQASIRPSDPR